MRFIAFIILFAPGVFAATLTTDGTVSDTASKITSAVSGDTVQLPLNGSFTWASGVTIPNTKGITLDFNGSTITRGAFSGYLAQVSNHATAHTRVTGGTMTETTTATFVNIGGSFSNARFRLDHMTFTSTAAASILVEIEKSYGLVDHCHFNAPDNTEHVHNLAYGDGFTTGWTDTVTPGTIDQVYFEDCTWTNNATFGNPAYFFGNSAIQAYYGARSVVRYCTLSMSQIDIHGGNTKVGSANAGGGQIDMSLQAGDSATYGPGKGKDSGSGPISEPCYVWNNSANMTVSSDQLTVNVGYFLSARPSYTALTYPHPDIDGSSATTGPRVTLNRGVLGTTKIQ